MRTPFIADDARMEHLEQGSIEEILTPYMLLRTARIAVCWRAALR